MTGGWRKLRFGELHKLHFYLNIVRPTETEKRDSGTVEI
jgi:hypothetical protein